MGTLKTNEALYSNRNSSAYITVHFLKARVGPADSLVRYNRTMIARHSDIDFGQILRIGPKTVPPTLLGI